MRFALSTPSHLQNESQVPFVSVSENKHQPAGSAVRVHQVQPPSRDNGTSTDTKLTENHLLLHDLGLGDVETRWTPSRFAEFVTGVAATALQF